MERRTFVTTLLLAGLGVTLGSSHADALPGMQPLADDGLPAAQPQFGVATPEDMEKAKIEKAWWRRRWYWRRPYWRRPYWRRRWGWRRRYWW